MSLLTKTEIVDLINRSSPIASLWSGFGNVYRIDKSIIKVVKIPQNIDSTSNKRKLKSYEIEIQFYKHYAHQLEQIANYEWSCIERNAIILKISDLQPKYPISCNSLTLNGCQQCFGWLATFHATFWNNSCNDLWEIGSYWHLQTRLQ